MVATHIIQRLTLAVLLVALVSLTFAQNKAGDSAKNKTVPALAVQVEPSQVKFAVQRTVISFRFTVKNEAGETVFDSGSVSDAELHWKLADNSGAALPSGLFVYELLIQENADSVAQTQRGHFIIERAADRVWVTTQEPQGLSVSGSQISVARDGDTLTGGARGEGKPTSGNAVEGKQTKNDKAETKGKLSIDTGASGGTTGYISRWTSATVLQDSVIFQDGTGRVGIGTTTPGDTLEVAGATNIGGSFVNGMNFVNTAGSGFRRSQFTMSVKDGTATKGLFGFFADSSTNPTTNQQFTIHDWVANKSRLVIGPNGSVGIGTSAPLGAQLHVNSSFVNGIYSETLVIGGNGITGVANTGTSAFGVLGTSTTGYGVRGDGARFGVYGSTSSAVSTEAGVYGTSTGLGGKGVFGEANNIGGIGVYGTSSSGYGVRGDSINGSGVVGTSASGNGVFGTSASGNGVFGSSLSASSYGIYGTNAGGGYAGYFDGNTLVNGFLDINFYTAGGTVAVCRNGARLAACSSSLRYKTAVQPFRSGLALLNRLRPISFTWKSNGDADLGLGAEDVAAIEPLLVTHNEKGEVEGVKYDRLGVVLINAVKEQQAQILTLQKQNAALAKRLLTLEQKRLRRRQRR